MFRVKLLFSCSEYYCCSQNLLQPVLFAVDSPLPPSPEGTRRSIGSEVDDNPEQPLIPSDSRGTGIWERFWNFAKKAKFCKYTLTFIFVVEERITAFLVLLSILLI
ncbi:hypothetical protein TNCV_4894901 [Trichonephila clavipes]|nr:hypothetical protein TNCV_4894901 [Trichonephila clavipes]